MGDRLNHLPFMPGTARKFAPPVPELWDLSWLIWLAWRSWLGRLVCYFGFELLGFVRACVCLWGWGGSRSLLGPRAHVCVCGTRCEAEVARMQLDVNELHAILLCPPAACCADRRVVDGESSWHLACAEPTPATQSPGTRRKAATATSCMPS